MSRRGTSGPAKLPKPWVVCFHLADLSVPERLTEVPTGLGHEEGGHGPEGECSPADEHRLGTSPLGTWLLNSSPARWASPPWETHSPHLSLTSAAFPGYMKREREPSLCVGFHPVKEPITVCLRF